MSERILIVEDDPVGAKIYASQLERAGFEVRVVTDGQRGLDELSEFKPSGLLIDFMLPKMNGLELVRRIRSLPDYKTIPLIVYSNAAVPKVIEEAKAAGATQFFDKSILTPAQLVVVFKQAKKA